MLRWVLPAAQMAVALTLIWRTYVWGETVGAIQTSPGTAPAFTLLVAINTPLALLRDLWYRDLGYVRDDITLVSGIGLLWYWVALNIYSWRRTRAVLMFRWFAPRIAGDLLLISTGVFWGLYCVDDIFGTSLLPFAVVHHSGLGYPAPWVLWYIAAEVFRLGWSVVLIVIFGRDLIMAIVFKTAAGKQFGSL